MIVEKLTEWFREFLRTGVLEHSFVSSAGYCVGGGGVTQAKCYPGAPAVFRRCAQSSIRSRISPYLLCVFFFLSGAVFRVFENYVPSLFIFLVDDTMSHHSMILWSPKEKNGYTDIVNRKRLTYRTPFYLQLLYFCFLLKLTTGRTPVE